VRIGSEAIVWLSKGQDGKPIDHVPVTQDGRSAEEAGQLRYYDHTNSSHGSNPNGQHTNASDVYVLHANSQYTTAWENTPRMIGGAFNANVQGQNTSLHQDFIFVPGDSSGYSAGFAGSNGSPGGNRLYGVQVSYEGVPLVQSGSNLHGVIFGDGQKADVLGPNEIPTSRNNVSMDTGFRSFEVEITASVTDPDVTELRSELLVEGLPAGAQVFAADGTLITPNAEGRLLIGAEQLLKNADGSLVANIKVTVPADVDSFTVEATAYAGTGESENVSGTGSATVTQ